MKAHELKTDSEVFQAVYSGLKKYEIRKDDRGYLVGDTLVLKETRYTGKQIINGYPLEYTGREVRRSISHILKGPIYGLADGWVILSF